MLSHPATMEMRVCRGLLSEIHEDSHKGLGVYQINVVITDFEIAFLIWFAVILYLMVPIGPILNAWSLSPMEHLEPHLITQCSPPKSLIEPPLFSPTH